MSIARTQSKIWREEKKEKAEDASLYDKRREEVKEIRESGAACVKEAGMCETEKKKKIQRREINR